MIEVNPSARVGIVAAYDRIGNRRRGIVTINTSAIAAGLVIGNGASCNYQGGIRLAGDPPAFIVSIVIIENTISYYRHGFMGAINPPSLNGGNIAVYAAIIKFRRGFVTGYTAAE